MTGTPVLEELVFDSDGSMINKRTGEKITATPIGKPMICYLDIIGDSSSADEGFIHEHHFGEELGNNRFRPENANAGVIGDLEFLHTFSPRLESGRWDAYHSLFRFPAQYYRIE